MNQKILTFGLFYFFNFILCKTEHSLAHVCILALLKKCNMFVHTCVFWNSRRHWPTPTRNDSQIDSNNIYHFIFYLFLLEDNNELKFIPCSLMRLQLMLVVSFSSMLIIEVSKNLIFRDESN